MNEKLDTKVESEEGYIQGSNTVHSRVDDDGDDDDDDDDDDDATYDIEIDGV